MNWPKNISKNDSDIIKVILIILAIIVCFRLTQGLLGIYHNGNYSSYGYFGDE